MPFGISNAPNTFMKVMTHVLRPFICKFVVDTLIYSKTMDEYLAHLLKIFLTLCADKLYENLKKCSIMQNQVLFLDFIMSAQDISADLDKVKAIREWSEPKTSTNAHRFYGLVYLYKRFIKGFSTISIQVTECLKLETFS